MATYYGALSDRLVVGAGEWSERLVGHDIECVAADPAVPERVFVGTEDAGLQRSADGGETWTTALTAGDRVTSVTVSPHDPEVVWAGTEPSAVYRSTDSGETWSNVDQRSTETASGEPRAAERTGLTDLDSASRWSFPPRPHTHHVRWLTVAPDDPDVLYVAIEAGAFVRSPDAGETWADHPTGGRRDNHTLAVHPDAPERVYTAAGDGYALSPDGGVTWSYPQSGLDHRYVWGVAVHPDDPETVVVSSATGPRGAHSTSGESYVYRTTGGAWHRSMDGLPGPDGLARAVFATDADGFLALTNHGLFHSNEGAAWERVGSWDDSFEQVPRGLVAV